MAKKKFERPQDIRQEATVKEKKGEANIIDEPKNYITPSKQEAMVLQGKFICIDISGGEGGPKKYTFNCTPAQAKEFLGGK